MSDATPVPSGLSRIKFTGDRFWWTVRAENARYVILTRQAAFQPKGTVVYTIIDRERGVRGPCNQIGQGWDFETDGPDAGAAELMTYLEGKTDSGLQLEVSYRNNVPIRITTTERSHQ